MWRDLTKDRGIVMLERTLQLTGSTFRLAYVDQGYTGPNAAEAALQQGIQLKVVKHPMAKQASCYCQNDGA